MSLLADLALVAGVATAVAPFVQARRILRRRSSDDVSLWWLSLYGAGCFVWIAYGVSIASAPLVASQAVAAVGAAAATVLALRFRRVNGDRWREMLRPLRGLDEEDRHASPAPISEVMLPPAVVVPDELVVEEACRRFFGDAGHDPSTLPVVDRAGRAVGVLERAEIEALPKVDRTSCLVADLADRDPGLIASMGLDAGPVLERQAVVRSGVALVVDRRRRLVGVAWRLSTRQGAADRVNGQRSGPVGAPRP